MLRHRLIQLLSATVMVAGMVAALVLCGKVMTGQRDEIRRNSRVDADRIAAQVSTGITNGVPALSGLGAWWLSQGKPMDREDWRTDGQLFLSRSPGLLQAIWVGANGFQEWAAAPGAEPSTKRRRPDARIEGLIRATAASGSPAISEVFRPGGIAAAFYLCVPIKKQGRPGGYVIGLYDARAVISPVVGPELRPGSVIGILSDGNPVYSWSLDSSPGSADPEKAFIDLPGRRWTLELSVPLSYFREFSGLMVAVVSVIGAFIYGFFMLLRLSQRRSAMLLSANAALEEEVNLRVRSELEISALNRELSHKVADFQTLIDVIPIGIAVAADAECQFITINPALAEMVGVERAVNISKSGPAGGSLPYRVLRNGVELRPDELPMQLAAATGQPVLGEEEQVVRADGSVIDILAFASPLLDEAGSVRGALMASVDISDRKTQEQLRHELERRLQRAQRMKSLGVMAAGIAHDFNNILTTIIGQASLACELLPDGSKAGPHLKESLDAGQHAAELIRKVLAYTGQSYRSLRPTNFAQLMDHIRPGLLGLAGAAVDIRFLVAPVLPRVMADPDEIQHVLRNLVQNAVEAMGADGHKIEICVDALALSGEERGITLPNEDFHPGSYVRVEVKDSGPGMAPEIAERAFDPFFSTKFLGRGLGLSEVLGIMRAHRGAVRLASTPPSGTSVELFFPAKESSDTKGTGKVSQAA